jgi:hypothetical protein
MAGMLAVLVGAGDARANETQWLSQFFAQYTYNGRTGAAAALAEHGDWHRAHTPGVPGHGQHFLEFHREYIGKYDRWRRANGVPPIPLWDPSTPIPAEVPHGARVSSNPVSRNGAVRKPTWLRRSGGSAFDPVWGHSNLRQFRNAEELGSAIDSGWHGSVHNTIGGDMANAAVAPRDPVFWRWHKFIDSIWLNWQGRPVAVRLDFDGDGRGDIANWRFGDGVWEVRHATGVALTRQWGTSGDWTVPGDYDGDGRTDFAVWRPSNGVWYIICSTDGRSLQQQWGTSGDRPVPGDYDGDGMNDFAIWRPSDKRWHILHSADFSVRAQEWGVPSDFLVPGDYDGDRKTDLAIWRPAEGNWWVFRSSDNQGIVSQWGVSTDLPVPGDYDGDGRTNFAIWRPGDANWFVKRSDGSGWSQQWGVSTDWPVPDDIDADNVTDHVIWRPSERRSWQIFSSTRQGWGFGLAGTGWPAMRSFF